VSDGFDVETSLSGPTMTDLRASPHESLRARLDALADVREAFHERGNVEAAAYADERADEVRRELVRRQVSREVSDRRKGVRPGGLL
jgi:hypothetical protein